MHTQSGRVSTSPLPVRRERWILLVSPQRLICDSLRFALRHLGFIPASFEMPMGSAQLHEVRRWVRRTRPTIGVAVASLDDAARLRSVLALVSGIDLRWILITETPPGPAWGAAFEAGVGEVRSSSMGLTALTSLLRHVPLGRSTSADSVRSASIAAWQQSGSELCELARRMVDLSPREMETLVAISNGQSIKVMARRAGVSEETVRTQVKSLFRKLGVGSQLHAAIAYRRVSDWLGG